MSRRYRRPLRRRVTDFWLGVFYQPLLAIGLGLVVYGLWRLWA